jgi:hypothetical protein
MRPAPSPSRPSFLEIEETLGAIRAAGWRPESEAIARGKRRTNFGLDKTLTKI